MLDTRYPYPFLPLSGDVIDATSTQLRYPDLQNMAGQISVGIYDYTTNAVATSTGNGKKFFIGYSSYHTKDKLDTFLFGLTNPRGRNYWGFKGSDVLAFEYSDPIMTIKSDKWALGYSGSSGCNLKLPKFECDKVYGVRVTVKGNSAMQKLGHNQTFDVYSDAVCCNEDDCGVGCSDTNIDCERILKQIAERFNNETQVASMFNMHARYITNTYVAQTTFALTKYSVNLIDDGSNTALALVQSKVANSSDRVIRTNRVGLTSTYQVCTLTAPTNVTAAPRFALPDNCKVCPAGSTTVAATEVFTIVRGISEGSTISTDAERTAFAASVAADYAGSSASKFVSGSPLIGVVELSFPLGTVAPVAVKADLVSWSRTTNVECTLPAGTTPEAWSVIGTAYRSTRTLCITLPRKDCGAGNRLTELQTVYNVNTYPDIVPNSLVLVAASTGDNCADSYNIQQYSKGCMEDECLAADTASFRDFGSYDETLWEIPEPAPTVYDANKKCGLVFTANITKEFIDDCEFDLFNDNVPYGLSFEVSWIVNNFVGDQGKVCDFRTTQAKKLETATESRQSGVVVLNRFIDASVYDAFGDDYVTPNLRRVLDSNLRKQVDRSTFYRFYYLRFKVERSLTNLDQKSEIVEAVIPVAFNRPDKMKKLEQAILSPLGKFGVELVKRKDGATSYL